MIYDNNVICSNARFWSGWSEYKMIVFFCGLSFFFNGEIQTIRDSINN